MDSQPKDPRQAANESAVRERIRVTDTDRRLRRRVALELAGLTGATVTFLLLFPQRPTAVDIGLALFALSLIALSLPFTRLLWSRLPSVGTGWRASMRVVLPVTVVAVLVLASAGLFLALPDSGWNGALGRIFDPHLLLAWPLYFLWGLLQQTLFQLYLLGRLRTLLPDRLAPLAILLTGAGYSLVHLPDLMVTAATIPAGVFWSWAYDRYRSLVPLALSHALLGGALYYWVLGKDLVGRWLG